MKHQKHLRRISSTRFKRKLSWTEQGDLKGFDKPEQLGGPPKPTADDVKMETGSVAASKTAKPKVKGAAGGRLYLTNANGLYAAKQKQLCTMLLGMFTMVLGMCATDLTGHEAPAAEAAHPGDEHDDDDDDDDASNYEVDEENAKAETAEANAAKARKKAGLPELEVDSLPSSIIPRMLPLVLTSRFVSYKVGA